MVNNLNYTLIRKIKTAAIKIKVNEIGEIEVVAPFLVSLKKIDEFVILKHGWIQITRSRLTKMIRLGKDTLHEQERKKIKAKKVITERLLVLNKEYCFKYQRVSVKDLRSRWGSCSVDGNLNFNYRLIDLPLELLDYVLVHELCHLKEMNHGGKFWELVAQTQNDYKNKRKNLKKYLIC